MPELNTEIIEELNKFSIFENKGVQSMRRDGAEVEAQRQNAITKAKIALVLT